MTGYTVLVKLLYIRKYRPTVTQLGTFSPRLHLSVHSSDAATFYFPSRPPLLPHTGLVVTGCALVHISFTLRSAGTAVVPVSPENRVALLSKVRQ